MRMTKKQFEDLTGAGKKKSERKRADQIADQVTQRLKAEYGPVFKLDTSTFGCIWSWYEKKISVALDDWICASEPEMKEVVHAGWIDIDVSTDGMQNKDSLDHLMKTVAQAVAKQT